MSGAADRRRGRAHGGGMHVRVLACPGAEGQQRRRCALASNGPGSWVIRAEPPACGALFVVSHLTWPCCECAQVLIALGAVHAGVLAWFVAAPKGENDPGSDAAPPWRE